VPRHAIAARPATSTVSAAVSSLRRRRTLRVANRRSADRTGKDGMSPAEIVEEERAYEASIAWIDAALGSLFDDLDRREILANPIVIVTSDHGMPAPRVKGNL